MNVHWPNVNVKKQNLNADNVSMTCVKEWLNFKSKSKRQNAIFSNVMSLFIEKTSKFLTDVYNSSKLDSNAISVIPSILFLSIAFVALYSQIHDYQSYLGWKGIICKVRWANTNYCKIHVISCIFSGISFPLGVFLYFKIVVCICKICKVCSDGHWWIYFGNNINSTFHDCSVRLWVYISENL